MMASFSQLNINKDLPTPAYLQLKTQLLNAIDTGQLPAGVALPSERELAEKLGLSRMTVRRAFEMLVTEKQLEQRQGSGTYVSEKQLEQTIDRVLGFVDEARNLGFKAGSILLSCDKIKASKRVQEALNTNKDNVVLSLKRLRTADDEPLALQTAHLIPSLANLSLDLLAKHKSLYKTLQLQFGKLPHAARQTIGARQPTALECQLLNISQDIPVLEIERTTLDENNQPFEYVLSSYRSDRYKMIMNLRAP